MKVLKRSLMSACLCEGASFLLIILGTRVDGDVISGTWYCKLGLILHWPGMKIEDAVGGAIINNWVPIVGVPLVLWFVLWVVVWMVVDRVRNKRAPNHTPDGICQPADGLPKPSV